MIEYPKVLYKGEWNPELGLGALQTLTVNSPKEERDALKDGFVRAEDVESLQAEKPKGKKSKADSDSGEE